MLGPQPRCQNCPSHDAVDIVTVGTGLMVLCSACQESIRRAHATFEAQEARKRSEEKRRVQT